MHGGELFDRIMTRGAYSEADARTRFRQVAEGLLYLHEYATYECLLDVAPTLVAVDGPLWCGRCVLVPTDAGLCTET